MYVACFFCLTFLLRKNLLGSKRKANNIYFVFQTCYTLHATVTNLFFCQIWFYCKAAINDRCDCNCHMQIWSIIHRVWWNYMLSSWWVHWLSITFLLRKNLLGSKRKANNIYFVFQTCYTLHATVTNLFFCQIWFYCKAAINDRCDCNCHMQIWSIIHRVWWNYMLSSWWVHWLSIAKFTLGTWIRRHTIMWIKNGTNNVKSLA